MLSFVERIKFLPVEVNINHKSWNTAKIRIYTPAYAVNKNKAHSKSNPIFISKERLLVCSPFVLAV